MKGPEGAYLVVELGDECFGLELELIEAVIAYAAPAPIPHEPEGVLGSVIYRSEFLGVAHLGHLLEIEPVIDAEKSVIVVVEWQGAKVGLVAERSHGLLKGAANAEQVKAMRNWDGPFRLRSVRRGDDVVHLLDLEAMLDHFSRNLEGGGQWTP